jgi:hypothetical protein
MRPSPLPLSQPWARGEKGTDVHLKLQRRSLILRKPLFEDVRHVHADQPNLLTIENELVASPDDAIGTDPPTVT